MDFLEQLFGVTLDVTARTLIAFAVVLVAILLLAWVFRLFSRGGGQRAGRRGRIARLAVLEAIQIDQRRRLLLLRRDNAEHLILIGGGSDLVIEQGILRAPRQPGAHGERVEPAAPPSPPGALIEPTPPQRPAPVTAAVPSPATPRAATPAAKPASQDKTMTDRQLAEMADRLKAALREPEAAEASPQGERKPMAGASAGASERSQRPARPDKEVAVPAGTAPKSD